MKRILLILGIVAIVCRWDAAGTVPGKNVLLSTPDSVEIVTPGLEDARVDLLYKPKNGLMWLSARIRTPEIDRVEYYNGEQLIGVADAIPYSMDAVLFEGVNTVWAKIYYKGKYQVDTRKIELTGKNGYAKGWKYQTSVGEGARQGVSAGNGIIGFAGEGDAFISQPVKGDFELILDRKSLVSAGIGAAPDSRMGIAVWNPEKTAGTVFAQTPEGKMFVSSVWRNVRNDQVIEGNERWQKITRRNRIFACYVSGNGTEWKKIMEWVAPFDEKVLAAIEFKGVAAKTAFSAVAAVSLNALQPEIPAIYVEKGVKGYALASGELAVVKQGQKIRLIASANGKYKSKSFKTPQETTYTGALAGNAARLVMATRTTVGGGLFLSENKGKKWSLSTDRLNFTDRQRGNYIGMNPYLPDEILAGSDQTGLWLSSDGGQDWNCVGLQDRIVDVVYYHPENSGMVYIAAGDSLNRAADIYLSTDNGKTWILKNTVDGVRIHAIVADKANPELIRFVAADGIYSTVDRGETLHRAVYGLPGGKGSVLLSADRESGAVYALPVKGDRLYQLTGETVKGEIPANDSHWGEPAGMECLEQGRIVVYTLGGVYITVHERSDWTEVLKFK